MWYWIIIAAGVCLRVLKVLRDADPVVIIGADDHKVGIQHTLFFVVTQRVTVELQDLAAGLFDNGLGRGGVPLRSWAEA